MAVETSNPSGFTKFEEESVPTLKKVIGETFDFRTLVATIGQVSSSCVEYERRSDMNSFTTLEWTQGELLEIVRIRNRWLFETGYYRSTGKSPLRKYFPAISNSERALLNRLDRTLTPLTKHKFLYELINATALVCESAHISAFQRIGYRCPNVERRFFSIVMDCPLLGFDALSTLEKNKRELFFPPPSIGRFAGFLPEPPYTRLVDLGFAVDSYFDSAAEDFFVGLYFKDNKRIRQSSETLQRLALWMRGGHSHNPIEIEGFSSLGQFADFFLAHEARHLGAFDYEVSHDGQLLKVMLPHHEYWFVERAWPESREQYRADPAGFVREHCPEIVRSTNSKWLLEKAGFLEDVVIAVGLESLPETVAQAVLQLPRSISKAADDQSLAVYLKMTEALSRYSNDLDRASGTFKANALATIIVESVVFHQIDASDAVKAGLIAVLAEAFLSRRKKDRKK